MFSSYKNNDSDQIGSLMTPPDKIDLLWISVADKSTEVEAASRILLQSFSFPNEALHNAHKCTTTQLGYTVHKLHTDGGSSAT
jgi:hypothetical protein